MSEITQDQTSVTVCNHEQPKAEKSESPWKKTKHTNLYLYTPSKTYWIRAKVRNRLVRKSLKTKSIEIAKAKMDDFLDGLRGVQGIDDPDVKFGALARVYRLTLTQKVKSNVIKQSALDYRIETLEAIERLWPELVGMPARSIPDDEIQRFALLVREKYSPTRYNGIMQTFRGIMQLAVDRGLMDQNPARTKRRHSQKGIPNASVPLNAPVLPDVAEFDRLLAALDSDGRSVPAANFVRFLAYTGARIEAARRVMPGDVDFERNEIRIPAIKYDTEPNRVPMIPEMRELAKKMVDSYKGQGPLIPIRNPYRALRSACIDLGIQPLTPHDLRHLFATRALESGVDVKTVATWLGHKDGGKLLLQRYTHLRNTHSQSMASKVVFSAPTQAANPQPVVVNKHAQHVTGYATSAPIPETIHGLSFNWQIQPSYPQPLENKPNPEPEALRASERAGNTEAAQQTPEPGKDATVNNDCGAAGDGEKID